MITSTFTRSTRLSGSVKPNFDRRELTIEATTHALKLRRRLNIELYETVCPFDIARELGVKVRFQNVPSMEGMYCQLQNKLPLIVLASERPAGRQNFSCAHEIGHHVFRHGTHLDEVLGDTTLGTLPPSIIRKQRQDDPKEFLADSFASFLLMPKSAVERAFAMRKIRPETAEPFQIYIIACYLGVGYRTLIEHLHFSLRSITSGRVEELRYWATRLPQVRAAIAGQAVRHVVVVDEAWENRSIDLVTDDVIIVPKEWDIEGVGLETLGVTPVTAKHSGIMMQAMSQGEGILRTPEKQLSIRVSKRGFVGLAQYRYWDDPDDNLQEGVLQ